MKHRLKLWLREAYARLLFHTGLHRVVDRLMPRRLTILFGHCVDEPACNDFLPRDMKIRRAKLEALLDALGRRYAFRTIGAGFAELASPNGERRSLVALSMDDGYRDNATVLRPLLAERGIPATVFLESRPLDERRVNWSHKYFWCLAQGGLDAEAFGRRYLELAGEDATRAKLAAVLEAGARLGYQVKRILKYDADPAERDRLVDRIFVESGGDEAALCERLYLDWDQARALAAAGFELGGHTVNHVILSRCDPALAEAEVRGCAESIERAVGSPAATFAYPFGRRWDYRPETLDVVRGAGFAYAVNTHAGTNQAGADPLQLARIPIDDDTRLHLVVAEACGGFELLRRVGLELSE